ncbi:MAG: isopentenyl-diphosphate Delta-isomerase [Flavobacteriales bacterium]|nr:isopentenyl-diphosphate Delta-isomerase [Flavobacteriales bacterium]
MITLNGPEQVVLVDVEDHELGAMEKLSAHREGLLHRAFSVFIFNTKGDLLLQQRALDKYHSAGRWSNTCCGHPRPGETVKAAAERRLDEEMGLGSELQPTFHFVYSTELGDGMKEHELDHVLIGISDSDPTPDPQEAVDWRWVSRNELQREMKSHPGLFTAWFPLCLEGAWNAAEEMLRR